MAKISGCAAVNSSEDLPAGSMRYTRPRWPEPAYSVPSEASATVQITGWSEVNTGSTLGARDRRPSRLSETPLNRPRMKSLYEVISQAAVPLASANRAAAAASPAARAG